MIEGLSSIYESINPSPASHMPGMVSPMNSIQAVEVGPGVPELHRELEVSLALLSKTVRGFVSKHIVEHSGGRGG